jgi:hypothetical protein
MKIWRLLLLLWAVPAAAADPAAALSSDYLERYFDFYPTRATAAGRHDLDHFVPGCFEGVGPRSAGTACQR